MLIDQMGPVMDTLMGWMEKFLGNIFGSLLDGITGMIALDKILSGATSFRLDDMLVGVKMLVTR